MIEEVVWKYEMMMWWSKENKWELEDEKNENAM